MTRPAGPTDGAKEPERGGADDARESAISPLTPDELKIVAARAHLIDSRVLRKAVLRLHDWSTGGSGSQ